MRRLLQFLFAAVALALTATPALALPCLSKAQAIARDDGPRYRLVDGQRCWYVVDRVPTKTEFTRAKRKEVVRRADRSKVGPRPHKTAPAVARAPVAQPPRAEPEEPSAEWLAADRSQAIEALCGDPCRVGGTTSERVRDAFDGLLALMMFDQRSASSWRAALVGP